MQMPKGQDASGGQKRGKKVEVKPKLDRKSVED
jgi:hypothetical protein